MNRSQFVHVEREGRGQSLQSRRFQRITQFTFAVTVFSQIKSVQPVVRPLMYILWILLGVYSFIRRSGRIILSRFTVLYFECYAGYVVLCLVASLLGGNHLNSTYLKAMIIPLLILVITDCTSDFSLDMIALGKTYVLSAAVFAIYVNITYFASYRTWLNQLGYAFGSKNSAAQIWGSAILISIAMLQDMKGKKKAFWIITAVYLLFVMGLSQCRTALLALGSGVLLQIIIYSKHKVRWIVGIAVIVFAFLSISPTRQFVRQAFLVEKYVGADLNTVSSGRLDLYSIAWTRFKEHFLLGVGSYYVDCSYISVLVESGIIGFLIIERIWTEQIWRNLTWKASSDVLLWKNLLIVMTGFYIVESSLEGLPPFGPGVCSFAFWYLSERLRNIWNFTIIQQQTESVLKIK